MSLLLRQESQRQAHPLWLYIPLCLYYYSKGFCYEDGCVIFTFHYVSITTKLRTQVLCMHLSLHSTMSLLLHTCQYDYFPVFLSLHSTMSLLLQNMIVRVPLRMLLYIPLCLYYYWENRLIILLIRSLHSTMSLLLHDSAHTYTVTGLSALHSTMSLLLQ